MHEPPETDNTDLTLDSRVSAAETFPYATAHAFRTALKAKLATVARNDRRYSVNDLQRQFAYDRLLARCFIGADAGNWVLKGAGALLARLEGVARHSKDIDLYFAQRRVSAEDATIALRAAANRDVGDHFRFEVTHVSPLQESAKGQRIHIVAYLGARFANFHVDVVVTTAMSGEPDWVSPLVPIAIPGLVRPSYRTFPIVDHLADKLCATLESHDGVGPSRPSSRVKDLVDIALIAVTQSIDGSALRRAVLTGVTHRGLPLPHRFTVPDIEAWRAGYPRKATEAPGSPPTFDDAVRIAGQLFDPVLSGPICGTWNPKTTCWMVDS